MIRYLLINNLLFVKLLKVALYCKLYCLSNVTIIISAPKNIVRPASYDSISVDQQSVSCHYFVLFQVVYLLVLVIIYATVYGPFVTLVSHSNLFSLQIHSNASFTKCLSRIVLHEYRKHFLFSIILR